MEKPVYNINTLDIVYSVNDNSTSLKVYFHSETNSLIFHCDNNTEAVIQNYSLTKKPIWLANTYYSTQAQNLIIEEGITKIGSYAFYGLYNITSIYLPSTLTEIGYEAFNLAGNNNNYTPDVTTYYAGTPESWAQLTFDCLNNTFISWHASPLPYTTKLVFYNSKDPTDEIILEENATLNLNFTSAKPTIEPFTFANCPLFKKLEIQATNLVEISEYAFANCINLATIDGLNNVKTIGSFSFDNCTHLDAVILYNSTTELASNAFSNCPNTTFFVQWLKQPASWSATWRAANTTAYFGIKNRGYQDGLFWEQTFSDTITIVSYDVYNTDKLEIPATINNLPITLIAASAFTYAPFTELIILSPTIRIKPYAFQKCQNLKKITIGTNEPKSEDSDPKEVEIDNFAFKSCTSLQEATIYNLTKFGTGVFASCVSLTNIQVTSDCYQMDADRRALYQKLPDNKYKLVQYALGMYTGVDTFIPANSTTEIADFAFAGANRLQSVYLPATLSLVGHSAFEGSSISSVYFEFSTLTPTLVIYENAFKDCNNLTTVQLRSEDYPENTQTQKVDPEYFDAILSCWCKIVFKNKYSNPLYYELTNKQNYPKALQIYSDIISGGSNFSKIELPDLNLPVFAIPDCTFYGAKLSKITYFNELQYIGEYAFKDSTITTFKNIATDDDYIAEVIVNFIGRSAFENCVFQKLYIEALATSGWTSVDLFMFDVYPAHSLTISDFAFKGVPFKEVVLLEKSRLDLNLLTLGDDVFDNRKVWKCNQRDKDLAAANADLIYTDAYIIKTPAKFVNKFIPDIITELYIRDDGTALVSSTFNGCYNLTAICVDFNNQLNSNLFNYITPASFSNCKSLAILSAAPLKNKALCSYQIANNCILKTNSSGLHLLFGANSVGDTQNTLLNLQVYSIQDFAFLNRTFKTIPYLPATLKVLGEDIFKDITLQS